MATLDCLTFSTEGWQPGEHSDTRAVWTTSGGELLIKTHVAEPPEIPSFYPVAGLQDHYRREAAKEGGAIISVDLVQVKGMTVVRAITKLPQDLGRVQYSGLIVIPFRDFSYSIEVHAAESQHLHGRETAVRNEILKDLPAGTSLVWSQDPYDPDFRAPMLRCLADDEKWDALAPQHALSKLRALINQLLLQIQVTREVKNSVPFRGSTS